jgi:hypothetical protein
MSRTKLNLNANIERKNPHLLKGSKPWQAWKLAGHRSEHNSMAHSEAGTKFVPGPGGINCGCCTRFPPAILKVVTRRVERRRSHIKEHLSLMEECT